MTDLACGRGACLFAAAESAGPNARLVGVDLAPGMIDALAAAIVEAGLPHAEAHVMDAENLAFEDGTFDVVLCGLGIFFFPAPDVALAEVGRVLRTGGTFAASTFDGGSNFTWAEKLVKAVGVQSEPLPSVRLAGAAGLETALIDAGFTDVVTTRFEERFVFPDVDAFVAWVWSHGGRRVLEQQLDDEGLARYRHEAERHLRQHAVEGGFELVQRAAATVARMCVL